MGEEYGQFWTDDAGQVVTYDGAIPFLHGSVHGWANAIGLPTDTGVGVEFVDEMPRQPSQRIVEIKIPDISSEWAEIDTETLQAVHNRTFGATTNAEMAPPEKMLVGSPFAKQVADKLEAHQRQYGRLSTVGKNRFQFGRLLDIAHGLKEKLDKMERGFRTSKWEQERLRARLREKVQQYDDLHDEYVAEKSRREDLERENGQLKAQRIEFEAGVRNAVAFEHKGDVRQLESLHEVQTQQLEKQIEQLEELIAGYQQDIIALREGRDFKGAFAEIYATLLKHWKPTGETDG